MSREILDRTKSHYTGFIFGKKANDHFIFEIPADYKYEKQELTIIESTMKSGARIDQKPNTGQTGMGSIMVHWWYNAFGKIRYNIKAWAKKVSTDSPAETDMLVMQSNNYSHYTGFIFGDKGDDLIPIELPDDYSFEDVSLEIVEKTMRSGARIDQKPGKGSTGTLVFKVHWWYNLFGKIRYFLKIYAKKEVVYKLKVIDFSWEPDPAKAGQNLTVKINVKNTGALRIEELKLFGSVYAKELDEVNDTLLNWASVDQRTITVLDELAPVGIDPNETFNISRNIEVLEEFTALGQNYSTAGIYRLFFAAYVEDNIQVATITVENFQIIK
ncbi:hypothetical protein ACFLT7_07225 [candidate division KSB1 bacterium]